MDKLSMKLARNSNIELLRIISMLALVLYHFELTTAGNFSRYLSIYTAPVEFMMCIGKFGLDEFMLISGYFMCTADASPKMTARKLLRLWGQIMFYCLAFLAFARICGIDISADALRQSLLPITQNHYWFASYYFVLLLLTPYINKMLAALNKKEHFALVMITAVIFIVLPSLFDVYIAYNLLGVMLCMYFTGAYIRLRVDAVSAKKHFLFAALIAALCYVIIYAADAVSIKTMNLDCRDLYTRIYANESIFMYSIAVEMLLGFVGLRGRSNPVVNTLGSLTFGVYLFHANIFAISMYPVIFDSVQYLMYSPKVIAYMLGGAAAVYAAGSLIDFLRMKLLEPLWMKAIDRLLLPLAGKVTDAILKRKSTI